MCRYSLLLLLLLLMLQSHQADGNASGCFEGRRTIELSKSDIVRTWQPDGDCQWWQIGRSETNRFPAAVRSGPRWLVMQLRQPMVLDRVSVRGWDGQSLNVSVVGAASLPLELQMEDTCRASWKAFNSSDRWRQLGDQGGSATSFLLLSSTSRPLQWTSVSVTGGAAALQFVLPNSSLAAFCGDLDSMESRESGELICFSVLSCHPSLRQSSVSCRISWPDGEVSTVSLMKQSKTGRHEVCLFEFALSRKLHGSVLSCTQGPLQADRVERSLSVRIPARSSVISTSPAVWLSGHPGFVSFATEESFPEPRHLCWIGERDSRTHEANGTVYLNATSLHRSIVASHNGPVFTMRTNFSLMVSMEMSNKTIYCRELSAVSTALESLYIPAVSEPCETIIDLGSEKYWLETDGYKLVRVTSSKCSYWNVTHSCRMKNLDTNSSRVLNKTQQESFSSEHWLPVSRWMSRRNWLVRCQLNQFGLVYPDVESHSGQQPEVFYKGDLKIGEPMCNASHMSIKVSITGGNPVSVSNVTCSFTDTQRLRSQELKFHKLASHWVAELPSPRSSSDKSFHAEIKCTASQTHNHKPIFRLRANANVSCIQMSPNAKENSRTDAQSKANVKLIAVFSFVVVTILLLVIIAKYMCALVVRQGLSSEPWSSQLEEMPSSSRTGDASESLYHPATCSTRLTEDKLQAPRADECQFVKVLDVKLISNEGADYADDEDDVHYEEVTGHYEPDGCTYLRYKFRGSRQTIPDDSESDPYLRLN